MKMIPLSRGLFAQVDDEDFQSLSCFKWYAARHGKLFRPCRRQHKKEDLKRALVYMGRQILELRRGDVLEVDYIDGDPLNNQRSNLRTATKSQQKMNQGKLCTNTSGFKGVSFCKQTGLYKARLEVNKRYVWLGRYATREQAYEAFTRAARKFHGKYFHG